MQKYEKPLPAVPRPGAARKGDPLTNYDTNGFQRVYAITSKAGCQAKETYEKNVGRIGAPGSGLWSREYAFL